MTPYIRSYFGKEYNSGFYFEVNTPLHTWDASMDEGGSDYRLAVGFGGVIGVKIVNERGWICDIYAGGARTTSDYDGIPRLGILFGKAF